MKICVVGAGAIGGYMAVRLAEIGNDVSVIARGAHLQAIKENGLTIIQDGQRSIVENLTATDDINDLAEQDIVLLALKAHQIKSVLDKLPKLFGNNTVLVTLQNGIPWWYFQKLGNQYENKIVKTVDPDGELARAIDPARIIGCIAYPAAVIAEPGVIQHVEGTRFPVGELDGSQSERINLISQTFIDAGFKSPVLDDIRSEIWLKLWGNLTFNPISALTHATLEGICQFPLSRQLAVTMMSEAKEVAETLGAGFRVSMERRIEGAEKVGKHKTSMLQDVEAGKALEIDGMLGVVLELAEITNTEVPTLRAIYASVSLLNQTIQSQKLKLTAQAMD